MGKDNFIKSINESEIKEGQIKPVRIKGRPILLARRMGEVYGLSNRCPHMGCPFDGGILREYLVMCPCHGWKFDIRNGHYQENPTTTLQTYKCKIENGKVYVEIEK